MKYCLLSMILLFFTTSFGQDLRIPDSISKEMTSLELSFEGQSRLFKVVMPMDYDSTKSYPVFLGLSGGNQTKRIVDYCYAAWFRNDVFKKINFEI